MKYKKKQQTRKLQNRNRETHWVNSYYLNQKAQAKKKIEHFWALYLNFKSNNLLLLKLIFLSFDNSNESSP